MQESSDTQPSKSPKSSKIRGKKLREFIVFLLLVAIFTLGSWSLYKIGYKNGETKATKKAATGATKTTPLTSSQDKSFFSLPAAGEVTAVSNKEISVKIGTTVKKASIDDKTIITSKTGNVKVSTVKVGSKALLFTKKAGNQDVATRVVIQ